MSKLSKIKYSILSAFLAIMPFASITPANAVQEVETPWGPDRTTFTWADPAPYATFNSIIDNPGIGDERDFVRVREVNDHDTYGDEVTVEAGHTYEVYIYYHNNADAHEVGKTAIGIADGASMKSSFPATIKKDEKATVTGTIFAADTDPLSVWDGAYMIGGEDVYLRYVPGSAIIHNGGDLNGQNIGPDYLFGDGALLGYNQFSGILPGCNEYAGYVTYQVFADAPNFSVEKTVVDGSSTVKVGDEVTFKIRYENTGTMDQLNVVVRDTLPTGLTYVSGSAMLYNNNLPDGKVVNDDIITESGMNIGDYAGGSGWAEVTYKATVNSGLDCDSELTNSAIVSTTDGNKTASVTLKVAGDGCVVPPTPENCETNPNLPGCDLPKEIVKTGPLEIVMAVIVVLGICGAAFYLWRTKRTLKTVESAVTGDNNNSTPSSSSVDTTSEGSDVSADHVDPVTPADSASLSDSASLAETAQDSSSTPVESASAESAAPESPAAQDTPAEAKDTSEPLTPAGFSAPADPNANKHHEPTEHQSPEPPVAA